jgi:hypothetical protein
MYAKNPPDFITRMFDGVYFVGTAVNPSIQFRDRFHGDSTNYQRIANQNSLRQKRRCLCSPGKFPMAYINVAPVPTFDLLDTHKD